MIITKEMFDEFVESAENHTILWTDTLALIGVTVGDVPDVDVIEAQAAEIERLREGLQAARIEALEAAAAACEGIARDNGESVLGATASDCAAAVRELKETQP